MRQIRNQIGRTMMEMLAVLAVIGVLTVGAIAGLNQAMEKFRVSKTHDDILSISQAVADLYAWSRRYPPTANDSSLASAEMDKMCKNEVFPDGCISGVAKNIYGGQYIVVTDSLNSIIKITVTGLPTEACNALASDEMDWGGYLVEGDHNPSCEAGPQFVISFY